MASGAATAGVPWVSSAAGVGYQARMTARLRQFLGNLADTFWLLPALLIAVGVLLALGGIALDRSVGSASMLALSDLIYSGGGEGARTLLGAVAGSTIGVAGTVFSITIAALALAAGQMGPRLLRNFVRDRGNQVTLGILLGTFCYSLLVLRSVRTQEEGAFVPHISVTLGVLLAIACVGVLVFFIGHVAGRINVDEVIELVSDDLGNALANVTLDAPPPAAAPFAFSDRSVVITDPRRGYLQELDRDMLADWAAEHGVVIALAVRPGDFVFPGAAIARIEPAVEGADVVIRRATALGRRVSRMDLEYPVRQLVEIAVRALSPGINDPNTAISVIDRIGAALCDMAGRHLPNGATLRDGTPVLSTPATTYGGLVDAMVHAIRQHGGANPAVLIRLVEVLAVAVECEADGVRRETLAGHVALIVADGRRLIAAPHDLADLLARESRFEIAARVKPPSPL